jgi:hypothetical protein
LLTREKTEGTLMTCVEQSIQKLETTKPYFYIISYFSHNKYRMVKLGYSTCWNHSKRMRKLKQLLPCFKIEVYQNLSLKEEKIQEFIEKLKPFRVRKNLYRHPITQQEISDPFYQRVLEEIYAFHELDRSLIRQCRKCSCALSDKFSCDAPDFHKKWLQD